MRILFDISHPAHLNFFKNAIRKIHSLGEHQLYITCLRRGRLPNIVLSELEGFNITCIGKHRGNIFSIIFEANLLKFFQLLIFTKKRKIDFGISVGSFTLGAAMKLRNKPNIQFDDDPESSQNLFFERITSDEIHIPPILDENSKFVVFNALKEWAYLSPSYFIPNIEALKIYNLKPYEYLFIREVSSGSLNYIDQGSFTIASFANKLDESQIVLLSLEDKSKKDLYPDKWILLEEPVLDIHSLIYYSKCVISSGDSMAREGSVLGRPSIYCGRREMKVNDIMKNRKLFFHLKPFEVPIFIMNLDKLCIVFPDQKEYRASLNDEWDDVTVHILNSINRIANL